MSTENQVSPKQPTSRPPSSSAGFPQSPPATTKPVLPNSVAVAFRVLEAVAELQPVGVSQLARDLKLAKSTVHRGLKALEALQYATQSGPTATWTLTLRPFHIGSRARKLSIRDIAAPVMLDLRDRTQETVVLSVLDGRRVMLLERIEGTHPVRAHVEVGDLLEIHASATGKAMVAASPPSVLESILEIGLDELTPNSITDHDAFRQEIERTAARGYGVNLGERRTNVSAVGAAIVVASGEILGGIGISAPSDRLNSKEVDRVGLLTMEAARQIAARAGG